MVLLLLLIACALAGDCPKETSWRNGQCYGAVGSKENSQEVEVGVIGDECCQCPRRVRLINEGGKCYYRTFLFRRIVEVSDDCCKGTHYQSRGARAGPLNPVDPAADEFHRVNGPGFYREGQGLSLPRSWMSRRLQGSGALCAKSRVNVRSGAGTTNAVVGVAAAGHRFDTTGQTQQDFTQVTSTTLSGWVATSLLQACPEGGDAAVPVPPRRPADVVAAPSAPSAPSNGLCPQFYKIWEGYPSHQVETKELVVTTGFCRAGAPSCWITNSCTVRTTMALNNAGIDPGGIGRTKWVAKGKRYLIRVEEGVRFLRAIYGKAYASGDIGRRTDDIDEQGNNVWKNPEALTGKAGIIHFSECGWSDATGHLDVWDGSNIRNHAYFGKCKQVQVFNVCAPKANPDYSEFLAWLTKTNAR